MKIEEARKRIEANKMTIEEMIEVLKYNKEMCLFDPTTGENIPMSEDCRRTADALEVAIGLLKKVQRGDLVGRQDVIERLEYWKDHEMTQAEGWHLRQVIGDIKSMPGIMQEG